MLDKISMRSASARLPGHPDLACDLVAESIVDEYLRRDPESRIRVNVAGGRGVIFVSGDILSQADFDVSALVKRTLGMSGFTDEIEPFVSLEPVSPQRTAAFRLPCEAPVTVTGYATSETDMLLPETVTLARRLARLLQDAREQDPEWFWLGPDTEVTVMSEFNKPSRVIVNAEHGLESLEKIRPLITAKLKNELGQVPLEVNPTGVRECRGLAHACGSSGRAPSVYGSFIPEFPSPIGRDPRAVEKAGAWLARAAARSAIKRGARAAMVQMTYLPEESRPHFLRLRDEQGRDLSASVDPDSLSLDRVIQEWWRPGLNFDAALRGFAGEAGLPWEE